ncbi:hypothetical protein [Roseomonas acroporae]|nr:hypothetical protein [Roseomonas acroporae]
MRTILIFLSLLAVAGCQTLRDNMAENPTGLHCVRTSANAQPICN